ncbi:DNA ligase 4 isoform X1 [Diachasmimorpha longicaudata]|uniref:DNA ligase 4 isoform X1 n=1 Tax=Diachasmimorpha longicaudata TaxID=58733 RepID=UPI0030B86A93
MTSIASQISFSTLCAVFEDIVTAKTNNKKREVLSDFLQKCRALSQPSTPPLSLFPILRLFLLKVDKERGPNGLKEKSLAVLYVRVFCLGKTSSNAKKLLNYREPLASRNNTNDFAERVFVVLKPRLVKLSSFSVEDINNFLDTISNQFSSNQKQDKEFIKIISECSALEIKWLTRLILKDLKLSMGSKKIFDVFHPDADQLFAQKSNLKIVCETLGNPKERINTKVSRVTVFLPFKPMLLERLPITRIRKFFDDGKKTEFIIQTKFDGERSQVHMKDGRFKYFTRHGLDITKNPSYGEARGTRGFLTNRIASLLNPECRSIILDGEMMGFHKEKKEFSTKGVPFDVKKLTFKSKHHPCLIAYDILLYNDELLINKPLEYRLKVLEVAFEESPGVLQRANSDRVSSMEEIIASFNKSIDTHEEGIVLKKINSLYHINTRDGSGCYKIKSDYSSELIHDLDLVIIGGYYGEGRHSGLFNSFLTACVHRTVSAKKFYSVVSVSNGLSTDAIRSFNAKFSTFWTKNKPDVVIGPKKDLPDIWIHPEHSIVLQVRASEMSESSNYPGGWTLRFPRVETIRDDKPFDECCTLNELQGLKSRKGVIQKLTKRHATAEDIWLVPEKKKRDSYTTAPVKIDDCYLGISGSGVQRVSRLFMGKEFCVMKGERIDGDEEGMTKREIERLVMEHSGKIVQNPTKETFCVLSRDSQGIRVRNVVDGKQNDVVRVSWVVRATREENLGEIVEFFPWEVIGMKMKTWERLKERFDDYYDDYFEEADEESVRRSLERVSTLKDDEGVVLTANGVAKLETEMFKGTSPFGIFRGLVGFFVDDKDVRSFEFRFMGGEVKPEVDETVTDVFVGEEEVGMIELYRMINARGSADVRIVKSQWIEKSFEEGRILDRRGYTVS